MKTPLITLALALTLVSCDKVKELADKAKSAAKDKVAQTTGGKETAKPDPALQQLVDQTPEGTLFRKDLPFPSRLEIKTTVRREISARITQTSAIEKRAEAIEGVRSSTFKLERAGDQVRFTPELATFTIPSIDPADKNPKSATDPLQPSPAPTRPVTFRKSANSWKPEERGSFHAILLADQITPAFDQLLIENALSPRPQWFAKRRLKPGDQIPVSSAALPMVLAGNAQGSLTLTLESFEPVDGHPCGVFSVTGSYNRKKFPDFTGQITDEDVSIESGKIWLSLLHPIVLREELDTIQTFTSGGGGGARIRGQGTVKISINRTWKPVAP